MMLVLLARGFWLVGSGSWVDGVSLADSSGASHVHESSDLVPFYTSGGGAAPSADSIARYSPRLGEEGSSASMAHPRSNHVRDRTKDTFTLHPSRLQRDRASSWEPASSSLFSQEDPQV